MNFFMSVELRQKAAIQIERGGINKIEFSDTFTIYSLQIRRAQFFISNMN